MFICRPFRNIQQSLWLALIFVFAAAGLARGADIITSSEYVVIMDHDSGNVLFSKNPDAPMKPASMSKLMTSYILFSQIKNGGLSLDDQFTVSRNAYSKGGSRTFLEADSQVTVRDLLRGIIVQSGNDASIVVAEGLAGTEDAFAELMTTQAKKLGMENTVFGNATGWPDEATTTTARDLAILARAMISEFPELYKFYAEDTFTYNNIKQSNRNPLLGAFKGADGLKTGHTEESGYGLVASATRNDHRVILVINGLKSNADRKNESIRLMNTAFRTFTKFDLLEANKPVASADVWMGVEPSVDLVSPETISRVMSRTDQETITQRIEISPDIDTPIRKGDELGRIIFVIDGQEERYPLVAARSVEGLPWHQMIYAFFNTIIFGKESATTSQNN